MISRIVLRASAPLVVVVTLLLALVRADVAAQRGAPPPPAEPQTARQMAPVDLTGYWAAAVTEDWQWRFVTPATGDFIAVPFNTAGEELAKAWDPAADIANRLQCKPFGAAAIFRLPTRVHITWTDDENLRFEFDLGTQTRDVHFDRRMAAGDRTWQGHAVAEWIGLPPPGRGRGRGGRGGDDEGDEGDEEPAARPGGLKVVTTNLRAQYLRMNGVPVSENATITDYLDLVPGPTGDEWLIVKTVVDDPTYLSQPYITSSQFKKEADGSKWNPTPCEMLPQVKPLPALR